MKVQVLLAGTAALASLGVLIAPAATAAEQTPGYTWVNAEPNYQRTTNGGRASWNVQASNPEGDLTVACLENAGDGQSGGCSNHDVYVNWNVSHYYNNCVQYDATARFGAVSDGEPAHYTAENVTVAVRNGGACR
ncbi:hypothetical protein Lesp02_18560 [Lentzea sp. NBRC 105346]|uniref:hypothetical protein n=1 Tax=Lentzea sp. NBRC 105346 TaxID=3032205 RepID=UPI0024A5A21A|nr:hypothetical protein [Lentzea sp. NBRC 105346]GLZ29666.1 hypothetical protein Lesp02_18560 [Lentzea sp. NBRC 105346]